MEKKELAKQTKVKLLELAKKQGLAGISRLKKAVLIERLLETGRKTEKKIHRVIQLPIPQPAEPVKTDGETDKQEIQPDVIKKPADDSPQRFPGSFPQAPAFGKYQDLSDWQEKITSSKYETSLPRRDLPAKEFSEPLNNKANQAVLMIKDPCNLYLYWEISASDRRDRLYVRVYDITGKELPETGRDCCFQIEVEGSSCYIRTPEADRAYYARIGYLDREGRFHSLATSNRIHTPPVKIRKETPPAAGLSERQMERLSRFFARGTLGGSSAGQAAGRSQENRFESEWASRAFGSLPLPETVSSLDLSQPERETKEKTRGFRFTLNTELIVYGATEPDAQVTVSGKPVQLRKDGTFSLRFALPDGVRVLPAVAISADRVERRAITPEISRRTNRSQTGS